MATSSEMCWSIGAEGRIRTGTGVNPLPPEDSVSANSTTSALGIIAILSVQTEDVNKSRQYKLRMPCGNRASALKEMALARHQTTAPGHPPTPHVPTLWDAFSLAGTPTGQTSRYTSYHSRRRIARGVHVAGASRIVMVLEEVKRWLLLEANGNGCGPDTAAPPSGSAAASATSATSRR